MSQNPQGNPSSVLGAAHGIGPAVVSGVDTGLF